LLFEHTLATRTPHTAKEARARRNQRKKKDTEKLLGTFSNFDLNHKNPKGRQKNKSLVFVRAFLSWSCTVRV